MSVMLRRSFYWQEYSDEDLVSQELGYRRLMQNCTEEIDRIHRELDLRNEYDAKEKRNA